MKYSIEKVQECAEWVKGNGLMEHGGATLMQFCREMDISQETYYQWMGKTEFSEAIKKGKQAFKDAFEHKIVASLFKSATGYEYEERTAEYVQKGEESVLKKEVVTTKQTPPNVAACIFLLTNLAPERWKNKQNTEHSGNINTGINFIVKDEVQADKLKSLADL